MTGAPTPPPPRPRPRRRRSDGERSRAAILREAAHLATVEGLDGLSISRLAGAVGMSKSGLFAHFGSKEELQLATIDSANVLFEEQVVQPAAAAATGLERLRQLVANYLRWVEGSSPGGCFFASIAAEMDTHPGPVRDRVVAFVDEWLQTLEAAVRDGQADGTIAAGEEPQQLAFEVEALLMLANTVFVISPESGPIERARRALDRRLDAASKAATR